MRARVQTRADAMHWTQDTQDTHIMENFTLRVCTFADTEAQEVILDATGHFAAAEVRR